MPMRIPVLRVAVVTVLLMLTATTAVGAPRTTVRFWHLWGGPDVELMNRLVEQFQRENPITVDLKFGKWENYYDQLTAAIVGGTAPNVAIVHSRHLPLFASDRILEPLNEHLRRLGLRQDDFMIVPWNGSFVGTKQWGVPLDQIMGVVLYYNTDLLRAAGYSRPPETGAEMIEMARVVKERTGKWGIAVPYGGFIMYRLWFSALYQNDGRLLTPDGKRAAFNSPAGVAALKFWVDLIYRHGVAPPKAMDVLQGFTVADVAMMLDGGWWYLGLAQQEKLKFAMTGVPSFFANGNRAFFSNSHNFVVPKQRTDDPRTLEATLTFIKWISDHSRLWGDTGGFVPARKGIALGQDYRQSLFGRTYLDLLPFGVYSPPVKQMLKIEDIIIRQLEAAMLQRVSPEEALARAEQEVNAQLK